MREFLKNWVQGVSGGTIAFVLGFYDKFINSLNTLISRNGDICDTINNQRRKRKCKR